MFEIIVVGGVAIFSYAVYRQFNPPLTPRELQLKELKDEYDRIRQLEEETDIEEACKEVLNGILDARPYEDDEADLYGIVYRGISSLLLLQKEYPQYYDDLDLIEIAEVKTFLKEREQFIRRGYYQDRLDSMQELYISILEQIPRTTTDALFDARLLDVINAKRLVQHIYDVILHHHKLYPRLSRSFQSILNQTGLYPEESELDNLGVINTYLEGFSPFRDLFFLNTGISIPHKLRFEHTHICAPTGWGKTQLIQYMLTKEKTGFCVIDSQGEMIEKIARRFDNVILIDPEDVAFPPALNMFDVKLTGDQKEKERQLNATTALYEYMFNAIGADLTQRQNLIFGYTAHLMLEIPDATIHTFIDVLETSKYGGKYRSYMNQLSGAAREFFKEDGLFYDKQFNATKSQIRTRLAGILKNSTFERIFSSTENKIGLFDAMNSGKIVLINTAKDFFQSKGSMLFGRFFIAMILQAANRRHTIPENQRNPWFVYIDEAHEYFDENIETLLIQARKYRVGLVLAHQYLAQFDKSSIKSAVRILVIPITCSGFIRSPDLPNAMN